MMHLQSKIWVRQNVEQVTKFFYAPDSLAKWDRSVAQMIPVTVDTNEARARFDTISPSGVKMNYEVVEITPERSVKILLLNSKMFKKAVWHFEFAPSGSGTDISCHIYFTVKFPYHFLYPVLYFNKKALLRDLKYLEKALDENYLANLTSGIKINQPSI